LLLNSLFDSHCLRYKHQATVQNAEIVGYIVQPLCMGKPIARFHCKPNRTVKCSAFLSSFGIKISRISSFGPFPNRPTVKCSAFLSSFGIKISRVSSFGPFPNRPTSSRSYKYSSVIHLYVVWRIACPAAAAPTRGCSLHMCTTILGNPESLYICHNVNK